jgi:septum formation protein
MLAEAGFGDGGLTWIDPPYDDPATPDALDGQPPAAFATATAQAKAASVAALRRFRGAVILAADTVCVGPQGELLGKPGHRDQAAAMLRRFFGGTHPVVTGVCLLTVDHVGEVKDREAWADVADVTWGDLGETALRRYIESDRWAGKAGGYNLRDRVDAGWPITVKGDPATVMGLPMRRLGPRLRELRVAPQAAPRTSHEALR